MDAPSQRSRHRIFEAALSRFASAGFHETSMRDVASGACASLEEVFRWFPRKEDFVLALYGRLAADLEARVVELPAGKVADRFRAAMDAKIDLVAPHRKTLGALFAAALDPARQLGVLGEHTEAVRTRVRGVFASVVLGATDRPKPDAAGAIVRLLYGLHLGLILFWTQDRSEGLTSTRRAIELARDLLALALPLASLPLVRGMVARIDEVAAGILQPPTDADRMTRAEAILRRVFRHRRLSEGAGRCAGEPCPQCFALHVGKVERFVASGEPVHLVLPAFPAKSANRRKTLGPLPDMGEELALRFLEGLCEEVREVHPPGARITICSDGRVFSDLVGVDDADVTRYDLAIRDLVERIGARRLDVFRLDDVLDAPDHEGMRRHLVESFAEPLEIVRRRAETFEAHRQMWNGIQRFLFEDRAELEPTKSRSQVKKACGELAHEVIRRSNAWSRLVADCFPDALRLSIHPQGPHSEKIGILLGKSDDAWLTPWHGVVVLSDRQFELVKRRDAEDRGACLVERDGRPSHFEMPPA